MIDGNGTVAVNIVGLDIKAIFNGDYTIVTRNFKSVIGVRFTICFNTRTKEETN